MIEGDEARAIAGSVAGIEVGALSTALDARWLIAYTASLGLDDSRYYDTLAAEGPLAHPLFSVCYEWPAAVALRGKTVREAWVLLGVHATHHVVIHRYPRADDRLLTRAQIIEVRPSRAGTLVVARFATVDRNGRPVTTTDYGSVYRGISTQAEVRAPVDPLPRAERPGAPRTSTRNARASGIRSIPTSRWLAWPGSRPRSSTALRPSRWPCRRWSSMSSGAMLCA